MHQRRRLLAIVTAVAALALGALTPAGAAPTCTGAVPQTVCGNRVVAEPETTTTFLQYSGTAIPENLLTVLEAIEALAPRYVEVLTLAEASALPGLKSQGGREIYVVRVTDEQTPAAGKRQVAASLSVHGTEPAGREGGIRYIEDLVRLGAADSTALLYAGNTGIPARDVLDRTETYFGFLNPDGWAAGDRPGTMFARGNSRGADLNRDFPTVGWLTRGGGRGIALSEPEARGWAALLESLPNLTTAIDIHGEIMSVNNAFSDLLWPAGVWDPQKQAQELRLAQDMIGTVERKFAEEGIVLTEAFPPGFPAPMAPANVATGYDVVGYDDSGFMGDYMNSLRGGEVVEIDVENFLSHIAPGTQWVPELERIHVAAVRGNLEATIVEALITDTVQANLDLGRVAYVDDPARVTSADGTEFSLVAGETQVPYDVSRLDYFADLAAADGQAIDPIPAADVATRDLSAYDTIVLADAELPADRQGRPVDRAAYVAALDAFATAGGQVLLTDRAVLLLDDLGVVNPADLTLTRTNAGHVDFAAAAHPYKDDLFGVPSQTYYEVPLGFPPGNDGSGNLTQAPHFGVTQARWEAVGGTTVGTVTREGGGGTTSTVLGQLTRGQGRIAIFGAILPQPVESLRTTTGAKLETPHPDGLAPYAVTIAGGQVLANILEFEQPGRAAPDAVIPEAPAAVAIPLLALGLAAGAVLLRRRLAGIATG